MEIDIGKVGIKGQIVIPQEIRKDLNIKSGEKMLIVEGDNEVILRPFKKFKAETIDELKEEIIDMKLGEKAMNEIIKGKRKISSADEFLKDMKIWAEKD